ncbi:MAG TPA: hypothetical protein VIY47_15770 [Ignavibacteriaceae bacterium]
MNTRVNPASDYGMALQAASDSLVECDLMQIAVGAANVALAQHFCYDNNEKDWWTSLRQFRKVKTRVTHHWIDGERRKHVSYLHTRECAICSKDPQMITRRFRYVPKGLRDTITKVVHNSLKNVIQPYEKKVEIAQMKAIKTVHEWMDFTVCFEMRRTQIKRPLDFCYWRLRDDSPFTFDDVEPE